MIILNLVIVSSKLNKKFEIDMDKLHLSIELNKRKNTRKQVMNLDKI